jgi:hypothetical protein
MKKLHLLVVAIAVLFISQSCNKCQNCKEHTQVISSKPLQGYPIKSTKEFQECEKADEIHNTSSKKVTIIADSIQLTETVVWECE